MIALAEQGCAIRRGEDRLQILLVEIAEHKIPVEIVESKADGRLALMLGREDQKESQRVAIGGHGVVAGPALSDQPLAEGGPST